MRSGELQILGELGIGVSPTDKLHINVADNDNKQGLTIDMLDVTNNPIAMEINNDGTSHGLYLHQDGVLAAGVNYGLFVQSTVAQTNGTLLAYFLSDHSSSTDGVVRMENDGTGSLLHLQQNGVLAASTNALKVYSNAAHSNSNSSLVNIHQDNGSATQTALVITNDGSAGCLWANQTANSSYALRVDNSGNGNAIEIQQGGVLTSNKHALYVYSNANQTTSPLVMVTQDNASSAANVMYINNDGLGTSLEINTSGNYLNDSSLKLVHSSTNAPTAGVMYINATTSAEDHLNGIKIDVDCNSSGDAVGLWSIAETTTGDAIGLRIECSTTTGYCYAFEFDGSEIIDAAVGGSQNKKVKIRIGSTDYFIPCYTA